MCDDTDDETAEASVKEATADVVTFALALTLALETPEAAAPPAARPVLEGGFTRHPRRTCLA